MTHPYLLILYYSQLGNTEKMAEYIAKGAESSGQFSAALLKIEPSHTQPPQKQLLKTNIELLQNCSGLALGSPTYFGNMAAPLKAFWDQTTSLWLEGALVDKPACLFTSTGSAHGGSESTLLSMMLPLLHHGMLLFGKPYCKTTYAPESIPGMPYGISHLAGSDGCKALSDHEKQGCIALGQRLAHISASMSNASSDKTA